VTVDERGAIELAVDAERDRQPGGATGEIAIGSRGSPTTTRDLGTGGHLTGP
jgi:hypothetical protein